jgi:hypothetical protein
MIAIQIISAANLPQPAEDNSAERAGAFCVVRYFGAEVCRTEVSDDAAFPVWQEALTKPFSMFRGKEKENNRKFFLERLEIAVYRVDSKSNKAEQIGVTKPHLYHMTEPAWYKLVDPNKGRKEGKSRNRGRILIGLTILEEEDEGSGRVMGFLPLSDVFPRHIPGNQHLYLEVGTQGLSSIGPQMFPLFAGDEVIVDIRDGVDVSLLFNLKCGRM